MLAILVGLMALGSLGLALYAGISKRELVGQVKILEEQLVEAEEQSSTEISGLKAELLKLEKFSKIPNIIERGSRLEAEITSRLEQARIQAEALRAQAISDAESRRKEAASALEQARQKAVAVLKAAERDGDARRVQIIQEAEADRQASKVARINAEGLARQIISEAQAEAKKITATARKDGKEKNQKVDEILDIATVYALDIRHKAEVKAREIGAEAHQALKRHQFYEAAAQAMKNRIDGYGDTYLIPPDHVLDELAYAYGFHKSGEKLKVARERVKIMERNGTAATCQYPDGWKKDYAIAFVLGAFNGKVDAILARIKPSNHGKLIQELRDVFALTNRNGEVFRGARIHGEFLEARLEELKWGVAVQKLKENDRDEQRALKDRIKEDEKARKELERVLKQAEREEELLAKALKKAKDEYDNASAKDRERYEAQYRELADKLRETEEKNRRAVSMAQQTKRGHVYVISNLGSFGEDVYKIGLTRRLEPLDRVRELGGASVPFSFDVHALVYSEDAPALEAALHRRFLENQVNKVNRRKEFFRLGVQEIRDVLAEMKYDVRWSLAADAREYRETLAMEDKLQGDPEFRRQWAESEAAFEAIGFDDEEDSLQEDSEAVTSAKVGAAKSLPRKQHGTGKAATQSLRGDESPR